MTTMLSNRVSTLTKVRDEHIMSECKDNETKDDDYVILPCDLVYRGL